ncbi:MAG: ATP-binding protein [Leptothrix sp. (in: b-proteobacteria)]
MWNEAWTGTEAPPTTAAPQRVIKIRRDYNAWVASETMEDHALRFTPRSARRWSEWRVANTAFGASSFLVLEAVGATLLVQYGFVNAALAILVTGLIIFLAGLPISVYAARHGLDMDLLTRGAGFGYIGSTVTSLIYASFTFIFFALEAAVMAYALELAFDIPPAWGYLACALLVIPLVTHGVTLISRLQVWTQPLWLLMLVTPYWFVFDRNPGVLTELAAYGGQRGLTSFDVHAFGAAMTVGIALMTQMGEQADYLRFMPEKKPGRAWAWWLGTLVGGPGWVIPGVLKMLGGALLAFIAIGHAVPTDRAVDPNQMYLAAWEYVFPHYGWAVAATALFVVVSQLKINVTNAYAGSLAWSNFFSRITHSHPGRVVWMVFNTGIALALMEMNVFQALSHVLGLYANVAIAWLMAVVADLVINKPLGLSPPGIEFRRAHLYDINPVGVGAMGIASLLSVAAHLGAFGPLAEAYSALIALVTALLMAPLIAWVTRGRYALLRQPEAHTVDMAAAEAGAPLQSRLAVSLRRCGICERDYEAEDITHCPAYQTPICSLCCTLDARCNDLCRPQAKLSAQWLAALRWLLPRRWAPQLEAGLAHYLLLMLLVLPLLGALLGAVYDQGQRALGDEAATLEPLLRQGLLKVGMGLFLVAGVVAWWLVLAHRSRVVAQQESQRQTEALMAEIASHRRTDAQLQQAQRQAEHARTLADAANQAKTRYITAISHELRTPLNSILGYAQLLEEDEAMPAHRKRAVSVIRRGGDHLLSLIEGTLDLARIEGGKLTLAIQPMRLADTLDEIAHLFELQAAAKGIRFERDFDPTLPLAVRADERRLRQILINLLGNAVKFTRAGQVRFRAQHSHEMARFEISDSGPGMSEQELERVFEPFERGSSAGATAGGGTGLGLTIARMLTNLMGGDMTVESQPGVGTTFRLTLFLPEVHASAAPARQSLLGGHGSAHLGGYLGPRRRILVVDNEEADRQLLVSVLQPLGFELLQAASGEDALSLLASLPPDAQPHAVFMDLAMPGIDGWETLRRLRLTPHHPAAAIVSANAFDQGLDNDVGIGPGDFFVKPVRVGELLAWLTRLWRLEWHDKGPCERSPEQVVTAPSPSKHRQAPHVPHLPHLPRERLEALQSVLALGYPRGVLRLIDELVREHPMAVPELTEMRRMAGAFQLDALSDQVSKALLARAESAS